MWPPATKPSVPNPSDVEIYPTPWVAGTKASRYLGPIHATVMVRCEVPQCWQAGFRRVITKLQEQSWEMGGNAVVAVEVTLDPFARQGVRLVACGTATELVPLF
jgi:uncharacterized protein YbjQ (UPF0145 family)